MALRFTIYDLRGSSIVRRVSRTPTLSQRERASVRENVSVFCRCRVL